MKLYYSPGACSLASHIVLEELSLPHEAIKVMHDDPAFMANFEKVSPLGVVPVLVLDNGKTLTEGAVILQYLADLKPEGKLAPAPGSFERVRLQEELNFIATEIHKGFSPLFALEGISSNPAAQEDIRTYFCKALGDRFTVMTRRMGNQDWVMPWGYTVADAYLYTVLNWHRFLKVDIEPWPALKAHHARVKARPATLRAMQAEGMPTRS